MDATATIVAVDPSAGSADRAPMRFWGRGVRSSYRRVLALAMLAGLLMAVPAPPADAAETFRFRGSGYGHGLGMSQWGAYGLAKMGWSYPRILEHFYQGADVRSPDLPARLRVGVAEEEDSIHVTAIGGRVEVWEDGPADGRKIGEIGGGATWTIVPRTDGFAVRDETGDLVGGQSWGGTARPIHLVYAPEGSRIGIAEADGPGLYGRGETEVQMYGCAAGCELRVVVAVGLEEYLYGLGEVPSSWPAAALRAQATAARSYVTVSIRRGVRAACDCHVSDGTSDQVYVGWSKEAGTDGDRWVQAVDDSAGRAVTYEGAVIQAFYAASDGGHSENVEDVWHGGNPAAAIPWLSAVCDPGESTDANPWIDWERSFEAIELTGHLAPYTGDIGLVRTFRHAERGESGRVVQVDVAGANGVATVTGGELRSALGLPDTRVWINADRNITGPIRERYDALMCAPGLATSPTVSVPGGAQQFFTGGGLYRNERRAIVIWLRGALDGEYRAVGAARGQLGVPLSNPVGFGKALRCTGCKRVDFEGGKIFFKPDVGAHALWGAVLGEYLDRGGPGGRLGFPETRVRRQADGDRWARFEHGTITCGDSGACLVS